MERKFLTTWLFLLFLVWIENWIIHVNITRCGRHKTNRFINFVVFLNFGCFSKMNKYAKICVNFQTNKFQLRLKSRWFNKLNHSIIYIIFMKFFFLLLLHYLRKKSWHRETKVLNTVNNFYLAYELYYEVI